MRLKFGCLALLGFLFFACFSIDNPPTVNAADATDVPIVVRINFSSRQQLDTLASFLDIWEVHPEQGYLVALLLPGQDTRLKTMGIAYSVMQQATSELNQPYQRLPGVVSGIPVQGFTCYRTVEEIHSSMAQLALSHPELAAWKSIGQSWEKNTPDGAAGYNLHVLVLSSQRYSFPKPRFFLMAAIHARELTTGEMAALFAEHLVNQYGKDPDITWLLDFNEIHILPMANPDGRKMVESGIVENNPLLETWRKNTNSTDGCSISYFYGVDVNRNSGFKWGGYGASSDPCDETYRGSTSVSEPETQAIQEYILSLFPDQRGPSDSDAAPEDATGLMITLHSYSNLVLWPWGWTSTPAPNAEALSILGKKLAYFNQYTPEQSDSLYATSGTTDDWSYGELGVASFTFEMGQSFLEQCSAFQNTIYPANLSALLYAAKAARRPYLAPRGPDTVSVEITRTQTSAYSGWGVSAKLNSSRYYGFFSTSAISTAHYSIDYPSWITGTETFPLAPADSSFNSKSETAAAELKLVNLPAGDHAIFIEARDSQGNWGVPSAATFQTPLYALSLPPTVTEAFGSPGQAVLYTITVQNRSSTTDSYQVTASDQGWAISVPLTLPVVASGGQISFPVSITPPLTASPGISDTTQIQVISQADKLVTANVSLTTWYVDYGFIVSPTSIQGDGVCDTILLYPIQVHNSGALTDTYSISLTNGIWTATYPATVGPIAPGGTVSFDIALHIPPGEDHPKIGQSTLEIHSIGNEFVKRTILITTRLLARYFLPWTAIR